MVMSRLSNCGIQCGKETQRNKPDMKKNIVEILQECNAIKYAAYRTAAKLRCLQRALQMDHIQLGLVAGVFYRHQLQASENEVMLESSELEAVLSDIFFAAQKEKLCDIKVDSVTEQMVNLLLNIYNGKPRGTLQVISAKVALVVLSSARLQEKYQYFFYQLADHNNCISRKKIELLLTNLTKITEYLSESLSFGPALVPATVESCIQQSQGTLGVTEDGFIGWLLHEPQLLVWMSTLYRFQAAEMVSHGVKCAVCKVYPITGLRYRCLHCLKYNQCQMCFFTGKLSKHHKLKHPMQEYCCEHPACTFLSANFIRRAACNEMVDCCTSCVGSLFSSRSSGLKWGGHLRLSRMAAPQVIRQVLQEWDMEGKNVVSRAYDGASVMAGRHRGVQKLTTSKEATVAFLRTLKNKFCRNPSKHLQYLPVSAHASDQDSECSMETRPTLPSACMNGVDRDRLLDEMDLSSRTVLHGSRVTQQLQPQKELQSIICKLEDENRQLQHEIEELCSKDGASRVGACLQDHRAQVEAQVERLKLLKSYLSQVNMPAPSHLHLQHPLRHLESTPIVPVTPRKRNGRLSVAPGLDSISPIMRDGEKCSEDIQRLHFLSWQFDKSKGTADDAAPKVDIGLPTSSNVTMLPSLSERSVAELSTWLCKGDPKESQESSNGLTLWLQNPHNAKPTLEELHGDLDDVIEKLQNMLTTNFSFEESFSGKDNAQLQKAATEIEDLVAGIIEGVEHRKRLSNGCSVADKQSPT